MVKGGKQDTFKKYYQLNKMKNEIKWLKVVNKMVPGKFHPQKFHPAKIPLT